MGFVSGFSSSILDLIIKKNRVSHAIVQVLHLNMLNLIVPYVALSTKIDCPLKFQKCSKFQDLIWFHFITLNGNDVCLFVTFPGLC